MSSEPSSFHHQWFKISTSNYASACKKNPPTQLSFMGPPPPRYSPPLSPSRESVYLSPPNDRKYRNKEAQGQKKKKCTARLAPRLSPLSSNPY